MKEFRVFPSIDSSGNLGTPTLVQHFLLDRALEKRDDDLASEEFWLGESP